MSKYNNKKITIDGIKFDSMREGARYEEIKLLHRLESDPKKRPMTIDVQPVFILQECFTDYTGKKHRAIKYVADFKIVYEDGRVEVEDVKGFLTSVYKLKRKMFLFAFPEIIFKETY